MTVGSPVINAKTPQRKMSLPIRLIGLISSVYFLAARLE